MQLPDELIPQPNTTSADWWAAASTGRLMVQRCDACKHVQLYPRAHCARCWGRALALVEASGRGTVHSWTVTHRHPEPAFDAPYIYAIVELEEGPRLSTLICGVTGDVDVGQPVQVTFVPVGDGVALPLFRPANPHENEP